MEKDLSAICDDPKCNCRNVEPNFRAWYHDNGGEQITHLKDLKNEHMFALAYEFVNQPIIKEECKHLEEQDISRVACLFMSFLANSMDRYGDDFFDELNARGIAMRIRILEEEEAQ